MAEIPRALTIGELSRLTGAPTHKVRYILMSRGLKPVARAGAALVYDEGTLQFVQAELRRIREERGGRPW